MSYTRRTWITGEVIGESDLNHMEAGIKDNSDSIETEIQQRILADDKKIDNTGATLTGALNFNWAFTNTDNTGKIISIGANSEAQADNGIFNINYKHATTASPDAQFNITNNTNKIFSISVPTENDTEPSINFGAGVDNPLKAINVYMSKDARPTWQDNSKIYTVVAQKDNTSTLTNNGEDGTSKYATQSWVNSSSSALNGISLDGSTLLATAKIADTTKVATIPLFTSSSTTRGLVKNPGTSKGLFLKDDGSWAKPTDTTYTIATSTVPGLVKIGYTQSGKNYPVSLNNDGQMYVNVPWSDTAYVVATNNTLGLIQIGYAETGKNYPVQLDGNNRAYVNVPWVDTDTGATSVEIIGEGNAITTASYNIGNRTLTLTKGETFNNYVLPAATSTTLGGVKLCSDTSQTVSANSVTATAGRTYAIQNNSSGQMVVNIPWESNTHYAGQVLADSKAPDGTPANNIYPTLYIDTSAQILYYCVTGTTWIPFGAVYK